MSKIKVSETFYSVQGEGQWTGSPSVFLRTFGCNFTCSSFGLPRGQKSNEPDEIAKDINKYEKYDDLPLVKTGCDSYAAWHVKFKHLSPTLTIDELVDRLLNLIPNRRWTQPNGQDIHLVITGGEPLLGWQRSYIDLLEHKGMQDLKNLTFETNATQPLHKNFADYLRNQKRFHVTWSCSPKLTVSGEVWSDAIRPDIVKSYFDLACGGGNSLYLKFVVADLDDLYDVNRAVEEYQAAEINCPVYLMPVGGTVESYQLNSRQVAEKALSQGWRYSPRLQVDLWGNAWGT
jgi:7-carboxy-7-deazaguanine synthase